MAVDINQFNRIKKIAEDANRDADRAEGALKTITDQLKSTYGVNTPGEAKKKQAELEQVATETEQEYDGVVAQFEGEWAGLLTGDAGGN